MKGEENIVEYLQRMNVIVNVVRGLGEDVPDEAIVNKVLRSLTTKYGTKVSTIEEDKDLKNFSIDELFGSLSTHEMRTISSKPTKKVLAITRKIDWGGG